jgi:hypothetical protein
MRARAAINSVCDDDARVLLLPCCLQRASERSRAYKLLLLTIPDISCVHVLTLLLVSCADTAYYRSVLALADIPSVRHRPTAQHQQQ